MDLVQDGASKAISSVTLRRQLRGKYRACLHVQPNCSKDLEESTFIQERETFHVKTFI